MKAIDQQLATSNQQLEELGEQSPKRGTRVVLMGYSAMGCIGFDALLRHGFEIAAVFTHHDNPSEVIWWDSLAERARSLSIDVHFLTDPKAAEYKTCVASYRPDFVFSFYYRHMIPTEVLQLAPRGALNLHGSLLPRYRGRAPVNWVLVNGEKETGVSLHYMVAKADAGDLIDQVRVEIDLDDTALTLFHKLEVAALRLLDRSLPLVRDGVATAKAMDLSKGSYFGGRKPADGLLSWDWPAPRIYNLVRAVTHPYPGAFFTHGGEKHFLWWALPLTATTDATPGSVVAIGADGVDVATGDGVLRLKRCQKEGEIEYDANHWAYECGIRPGDSL